MTIRTQEHRPDTCTCWIVEQYDDADAIPVYSLSEVKHRGDEHSTVLDSSLISTIYEEEYRKNFGQAKAAELAGVPLEHVDWSYDPGRTLILRFPLNNVANSVKQAIQSWCDANLVGPVTVL